MRGARVIFQERVDGDDVRVMLAGDEVVSAAAIRTPRQHLDCYEQVLVPDDVHARCRRAARECGLVCAGIDLKQPSSQGLRVLGQRGVEVLQRGEGIPDLRVTEGEPSQPKDDRAPVVRPQVRWHSYFMKTTISSKGQLVLPRVLRERDDIKEGQEFTVERVRAGEYRLLRQRNRNEGLVARLLACPAKDWFVPLPTESTDTL